MLSPLQGNSIRQARSACLKLSELMKKDHVSCNASFVPWSFKPKQCCLRWMPINEKRGTPRFACRSNGLNQANQLRPRHNKIQLVEKVTLACSLSYQFKSGGGEGSLFHQDIEFESCVYITFQTILKSRLANTPFNVKN